MNIPRFWREIQGRYNLKGTHCKNCDTSYFPPRLICPACHRESMGKMEQIKLSGQGTITSHTTIHSAPRAFKMQVPYTMAIIQMEEGPQLTAQIIDIEPNTIKIGDKVQATFRKLGEDSPSGVIHYGYKFRLQNAPASSKPEE